MDEPLDSKSNLESLRVQLVELNNRSRWYSSQLWQVPFVYIGVCGVLIGGIKNGDLIEWLLTSSAIAIVGPFVIWHMRGIANGERRAVKNLRLTEKALNLPVTAQYRRKYTAPFQILVIVVFSLSLIAVLSILSTLCLRSA